MRFSNPRSVLAIASLYWMGCACAAEIASPFKATAVVHGVTIAAITAAAATGEAQAPIEVRAGGKLITTLHGVKPVISSFGGPPAKATAVLVSGMPKNTAACKSNEAIMFFVHADRRVTPGVAIDNCTQRLDVKLEGDGVTVKLLPTGGMAARAHTETIVWKNGVRM